MRNEKLRLITPGEAIGLTLALIVLCVAAFGFSQGCAHAEQTPEQYLSTVRSHLHIPEPVDLHFWKAPTDCFGCMEPVTATVHWKKQAGRWQIVMSGDWWMEASYSERLETLSHEVCHMAYDHDVLMYDGWYALDLDDIRDRQQRAESCAIDILRRMQDRR